MAAAVSYSMTGLHPEAAGLDADDFKVQAYYDTIIWFFQLQPACMDA